MQEWVGVFKEMVSAQRRSPTEGRGLAIVCQYRLSSERGRELWEDVMDRRQGEGKRGREKNKLEVKRKLGREIQALPTLPAWWAPATQGTDMGPMSLQTVRDTASSQAVLHQDFPQFRGSVLLPKDLDSS